jgi:hypothetical protein
MFDVATFNHPPPAKLRTMEISVRGKWVQVPAMDIGRQTFIVRGGNIRIASLHDEDYVADAVINPAACIRAFKDKRNAIQADLFRFSQKEPDVVPHYHYPLEMRSVAVAHVTSYEDWWQKVSHGTKCNIKQSRKRGVEIRIISFDDDFVRGIMSIQNESPVRQGRRFYHYGKTFEQVKRDHGSYLNSCDFVAAYFGDELIGFLKMVYRGNAATIMQINSKLAFQDKRPTNALLDQAVRLCEAKGISYLIYGDLSLWNKRESSLRDFKLRNGFEEMLVPSYYVPLTAWGWLCVKSRLYRGMHGILPGRAINAALELRRKWYDYTAKANISADTAGEGEMQEGSVAGEDD